MENIKEKILLLFELSRDVSSFIDSNEKKAVSLLGELDKEDDTRSLDLKIKSVFIASEFLNRTLKVYEKKASEKVESIEMPKTFSFEQFMLLFNASAKKINSDIDKKIITLDPALNPRDDKGNLINKRILTKKNIDEFLLYNPDRRSSFNENIKKL